MDKPNRNRPTDLRRHRASTDRSLILGGGIVVVVIGGTLIYLLWGLPATLAAFGAFAIVIALALVLWVLLKLIEWLGRDRG